MTLPLWSEPAGEQGSAEPRRVTLVRLAAEIARCTSTIGSIEVEGEVHQPRTSRTGSVYFILRDRAVQMSVVLSAAGMRKSRVIEGERVSVVGTLEWTASRGQLGLKASLALPVGEGAIAAMLAERREMFLKEGLIGRQPRRVPVLPRVIGVVCGTNSAVRKDIESVVAVRFPRYPLKFQETTVSGPMAAESIAEALAVLAAHPSVDVIILARGGGDATQLLVWSDEQLCRSIAACRVPVVSAIGHDADRPLCDEVADHRYGTPSIAAQQVVPSRVELESRLESSVAGAISGVSARLDRASWRLSSVDTRQALNSSVTNCSRSMAHARDRLKWADPSRRVAQAMDRLAAISPAACLESSKLAVRGRLDSASRHLEALSPQRVLERGFAIVRASDGSVVRDSSSLDLGDVISVRVARGDIAARVEKVKEDM